MTETNYLRIMQRLLDDGEYREGRNGGTYSLFGEQMRFDLREGFPLLTTKRVHFKSVVVELLWMLRGDTNVKYLRDHGVTIWDSWRSPYRIHRKLKPVPIRKKVGQGYTGDFSTKGVNRSRGDIRDKLANIWRRMMQRCYDPTAHNYRFYGAVGATVHPDWHDPVRFVDEVQNIPHWWYKRNNWSDFELDKDYFGAGEYGPNTSVWLHKDENAMYMNVDNVKVTRPDGSQEMFVCMNDAARQLGMSNSTLCRYLNDGLPTMFKGRNKVFYGWSFEYEASTENLRYELIPDGELGPVYGSQWRNWSGTHDQIRNVIDSLRRDPYSRRHIVSAWNVAEIDKMALPPCHTLFQFYVAKGRLSCQLYQRSADWFLGVPFNIASYALLTHLIAREVGLEVGEFVHTFGDLHLYASHVDAAREQLTRSPMIMPDLRIAENVSLFNLEPQHIKIDHYYPHPTIKAEVSK